MSKPYSHEHQEKTTRFRQEILCIKDVLQDQLDCVLPLLQRVGRGAVYIPRAFEAEREQSILQGCVSSIRARIRLCNDMDDNASRLSDWVSYY